MESYVKESHCWIWKTCFSSLMKLETRASCILQLQKETTYSITTVHQSLSAREIKMPGREGSRTGSDIEWALIHHLPKENIWGPSVLEIWDLDSLKEKNNNNNNKIKTSGKCHTAAVWLSRQQPRGSSEHVQGPSLRGLKHPLCQRSEIPWRYFKNKVITSGRC